jgi:hypothetical protein
MEERILKAIRKKYQVSWAPVAHACNPSYSGGRDWEDCVSKPAPANTLQDSISKKPFTKKRLAEWLKVEAQSSNPRTEKKKEVPIHI